MVATFNEQMQSQTDQILRIFQGLQEQQVATSLRPTVEESENRIEYAPLRGSSYNISWAARGA